MLFGAVLSIVTFLFVAALWFPEASLTFTTPSATSPEPAVTVNKSSLDATHWRPAGVEPPISTPSDTVLSGAVGAPSENLSPLILNTSPCLAITWVWLLAPATFVNPLTTGTVLSIVIL